MSKLFLTILNMSLTASYVIIFVILVRLMLKKAPKLLSYILWSVVAFRLLIPFSFESVYSLLPRNANTAPIPYDIMYKQLPQINSGINAVDSLVSESLSQTIIDASANPLQIYIELGAYLWILGIAILLMYSLVSILVLKRHLKNSQLVTQNIYEVENLKTPFVIGFIKPKIYLPVNLSIEEKSYILLHEQTHIHRKDHIIKIFAFIILSIHWFNPLVWIAFKLTSTDMELSCDERVLKEMSNDIKKPYATSLLSLAVGRHILNGSPIAFGEGNLKERIKNVLNYKKPKFWILILSIVIVTVVGIGLIANPKAIGIIGGADRPTDLFISSENKDVIAEADDIKLYANNTTDGFYNEIIVQAKDKTKVFSWINVTNPTYAPSINVADINLDGNDELIITLTTDYGTGVLHQEMHVLNTKELSEINIQDPIEIINKEVTSSIAENEGKVNVTVK